MTLSPLNLLSEPLLKYFYALVTAKRSTVVTISNETKFAAALMAYLHGTVSFPKHQSQKGIHQTNSQSRQKMNANDAKVATIPR